MLANVAFVVLLLLVLYGLYRLWRSSLGAESGAAGRSNWRRLFLQPHLEVEAESAGHGVAATDNWMDRGDGASPQSLMGASSDPTYDDEERRHDSPKRGADRPVDQTGRPARSSTTTPPRAPTTGTPRAGAGSPDASTGAASGGRVSPATPVTDTPGIAQGVAPAVASGQASTGSWGSGAAPRTDASAPSRPASASRGPASIAGATDSQPDPDRSAALSSPAERATRPPYPGLAAVMPDASRPSDSPAGEPLGSTEAFGTSRGGVSAERAQPVVSTGAVDEDDDEDEEDLMEATVDLERFEALEREVETLREVNARTLELERRLAAMDTAGPQSDLARDRSAEAASAASAATARTPVDAFTASVGELRDEIARSPLDPIARRRLMSELETYRLRGRHDDGLLTSVRHQLQRAQTEFRLKGARSAETAPARLPPDEPRERIPPLTPAERAAGITTGSASLFEAERPRDETERLRADLALRERQIGELRDALARGSDREDLAGPFDRVPGRDDLKAIQGIGKRMERVLNDLGVTTFAQLAAFEQRHIDRVADQLQDLPDDIEAENWVGQARDLLARRRRERETSGD